MTRSPRPWLAPCAVLLTLTAAAGGGCASREPLASYYVLTPATASASNTARPRGARVFIRQVTVPGYLQPTRLASRRGDGQIEYATSASWAEGHREGFGRALADALASQPGIAAASAPPQNVPPPRDYDLVVEVERFEGDDHGEVVLAARWQLYRPGSGTPVRSRQSLFRQSGWTYGDDAGQARMLGENVRALAAQIATGARR